MYVVIMLEKFNKTPLNTKTIYICMTFSPALLSLNMRVHLCLQKWQKHF